MTDPKSDEVTARLAEQGVFKGFDGLEGLANADEFWINQMYGTRLYYGPGIGEYLHRSVLQAAIKAIKEAPSQSDYTALQQQLARVMEERDKLRVRVQMGYMRHNAIVVTSYNGSVIEKAREVAISYFGRLVTPLIESPINSYVSFFVAPDGSKEGWEESDRHDQLRLEYTNWLNRQRFSDGSTSLCWAEIQYGDDEYETKIIRHSDEITASDDYTGPAELDRPPSLPRGE